MLPRLYKSDDIADAIMADFETAPIPELHKVMFRWVEKFTRRSWEMTPADIETLRDAGVEEAEIVDWAQVAALQTWWVMQADGGGIPLEGDAVTGTVVGHERDWYHAADAELTASAPSQPLAIRGASVDTLCWVETQHSDEFEDQAQDARDRWGFVPNLFTAVSLKPDILPRHQLGLELLEAPRSTSLSARQHGMVRALTTSLNHAPYSRDTAREQLRRTGAPDDLFDKVTDDYTQHDWSPGDRAVLDFASKMAANAYKVWEADAQSFRDSGLDDEAYLEVLEVVSIQSSLDRLANSLGVVPDGQPILSG